MDENSKEKTPDEIAKKERQEKTDVMMKDLLASMKRLSTDEDRRKALGKKLV